MVFDVQEACWHEPAPAIGHHDPAPPRLPARRQSTGLPLRRREPGLQLLQAVMTLAGPNAQLLCQSERPWASATFSGSRHMVRLEFAGEAAMAAGETFIEALPEHEFRIPRQLVADATICEVVCDTLPHPRLTVEAELLLLEDN